MAVKIGHAVHDENGGLNGISGDQIQQAGKKGEEVQISKWYVSGGGWGWYIEAKDPALRERMAAMMEVACANPNIGYSRTNRQKWYTTTRANGGNAAKANGDCDCSSLVSGITNLCGKELDIFSGITAPIDTVIRNIADLFTIEINGIKEHHVSIIHIYF